MSWTDRHGKTLSESDYNSIQKMYDNIFEAMLNTMQIDQEFLNDIDDRENSKMLVKLFREYKEKIFREFNEKTLSHKKMRLDTFFAKRVTGFAEILENQRKNIDQELLHHLRNTTLRSIYERIGAGPYKVQKKDTYDGLKQSMKSFKLTSKPLKGIETIKTYASDGTDYVPLNNLRKGNSGTFELAKGNEKIEKKYMDALAYSYAVSETFTKKNKVSFGDLYTAFSKLNELLVESNEVVKGGKIRGEDVKVNDSLKGISPIAIPGHLYYFLNKVAENINKIKKTTDPNLQKSQAVQLAAFIYQMAVAEHVFADGNGRTCRLLSDIVLQTFGMPPHTPNPAMMGTIDNIGNPMNYEKGAAIILQGVKVSNDYLELMKGNDREGITNEAKRILNDEKIDTGIVDEKAPKASLELAIKIRENKNALIEACDDFITANHIGSKNSEQYRALVRRAMTLKTLLETESMHSANVINTMKSLQKDTQAYFDYTKIRDRKDSTRRARLDAARRIFSVVHSSAKVETEILESVNRINSQKSMVMDTKTTIPKANIDKQADNVSKRSQSIL